jgi:hypothetical protein
MDRRPNDDTHRERRVWLGDLNPFKEYIESGQLNRLLKGMYGFLSISLSLACSLPSKVAVFVCGGARLLENQRTFNESLRIFSSHYYLHSNIRMLMIDSIYRQ